MLVFLSSILCGLAVSILPLVIRADFLSIEGGFKDIQALLVLCELFVKILKHRLILNEMLRHFHFHVILSLDLLLRENLNLLVEILHEDRNLGLNRLNRLLDLRCRPI